jgi:hypothetical protein
MCCVHSQLITLRRSPLLEKEHVVNVPQTTKLFVVSVAAQTETAARKKCAAKNAVRHNAVRTVADF